MTQPASPIKRRVSKQIMVGKVPVGGDAPITVQTMTNTRTTDVAATVAQIQAIERVGADIVRVSVPTMEAARITSYNVCYTKLLRECGPWCRLSGFSRARNRLFLHPRANLPAYPLSGPGHSGRRGLGFPAVSFQAITPAGVSGKPLIKFVQYCPLVQGLYLLESHMSETKINLLDLDRPAMRAFFAELGA